MRLTSLAVLALLWLLPWQVRAEPATMFAAASLTDALRQIASLWEKSGHPAPRLSFGASSALARQIDQGAPANLFASADEKWMDFLAGKGLIVPDTRRDLLGNDLVLVVPADRPQHVAIGPGFDLQSVLGANGRLATGDPAHVPVGLYAEQALRKLGLWDTAKPRLARTDDVRAALLLVERGEAPAAIVYATDAAVSKKVMVAGVFPESAHDPIRYPFAVLRRGDTPDARALLAYIEGPEARAVFDRLGFKAP